MCCYVALGLDMNILGSVEPGGAAGANAIRAEDLDYFLFERLIRDKVVKVVRGEIGHGPAVR